MRQISVHAVSSRETLASIFNVSLDLKEFFFFGLVHNKLFFSVYFSVELFFSKKLQAPPPWSSNGRPLSAEQILS